MQFFERKMVRSKGLEPSLLLGTTTSRLRVYQFHHERIRFFSSGLWCFSKRPKNDLLTFANTFSRKISIPNWCPTCAWRVFGKHHFPSAEAERVSWLAVLAVPPKCAVRDAVETTWSSDWFGSQWSRQEPLVCWKLEEASPIYYRNSYYNRLMGCLCLRPKELHPKQNLSHQNKLSPRSLRLWSKWNWKI